MRVHLQAIAISLPDAPPRRRWSARVVDAIAGRRRRAVNRFELTQRLARKQLCEGGADEQVRSLKYRVRPW